MITARQWAINAARHIAPLEVATAAELPLAEFQAHAASRLTSMVQRWGGALLADAVGLGKTRVAITVAVAVAREQRICGGRGNVWLCVPARLRDSWVAAARAGGLEQFEVVTHTALSRGAIPDEAPLFVVIDEAHRFRNPATRRRRTLSHAADAPMLLVTATPVANSMRDLWNLLRLFLDDEDARQAFGWDLDTAEQLANERRWDPAELVREVTVRRTSPPAEAGFGRRPSVALEVVGYDPTDDEAWLWTNLEPSVRQLHLIDEADDWPTGLFVEHVLRRWESGPDALGETLRELHGFAVRRLRAARQGRSLDRRTFREIFGAQPQQEVFPFLYPTSCSTPSSAAIAHDVEVLANLIGRVDLICRGETGRDAALVELARRVSSLLVFTSYKSSAHGLFDRFARDLGVNARVGLVTGDGARATGLGRTSPSDVLRRFAPTAHHVELRDHERLDVLVATDCIAEGVNLQDCGHVVLADLPYSPLGVEQRIGRLLRPGSPHEQVHAYLCRPTNWNDSLGMRRRLQSKLQAAHRVGFNTSHSPFAALTALDELARLAEVGITLPAAATLTEAPTIWLVLADVDGRPWFFALGGDVDFASALAELVWDNRRARACDVPSIVTSTLQARESFLRAAVSAPTPLELDAPEARAWRLLVDAGVDDLDAIRPRLLRRQRLSARRQLERLVETRSSARLARYVRTLRAPEPAPSIRLVAALGI